MKFIGPTMKNIGGGGTSPGFSNMDTIVYSNTRPNDLENGLWIKNTKQLPLMNVNNWNKVQFKNNHTIEYIPITPITTYQFTYLTKYSLLNYDYDKTKLILICEDSGRSLMYDILTDTYTSFSLSFMVSISHGSNGTYTGHYILIINIGQKFYCIGGQDSYMNSQCNYIMVCDAETNTRTNLSFGTMTQYHGTTVSDTGGCGFSYSYVIKDSIIILFNGRFGGSSANNPSCNYIEFLDTSTNTITNMSLPSGYIYNYCICYKIINNNILRMYQPYNYNSSTSTTTYSNKIIDFDINSKTFTTYMTYNTSDTLHENKINETSVIRNLFNTYNLLDFGNNNYYYYQSNDNVIYKVNPDNFTYQ